MKNIYSRYGPTAKTTQTKNMLPNFHDYFWEIILF
jgi:hypothetical protein